MTDGSSVGFQNMRQEVARDETGKANSVQKEKHFLTGLEAWTLS